MRDPRYQPLGHPEGEEYRAWVSRAWRPLQDSPGGPDGDGLVWVQPYTRRRDGETQEVSGHFRHAGGGGDGERLTAQDAPAPGVERRYTARDAAGGLIGRCETLGDGSQICTLAMPDGGLAVQQLRAEGGEFTPIAAPAVADFGFTALLGAATGLYNHLREGLRGRVQGGVAPDTPFLFF
ncbi:hypothetical protein KTR66_07315 [Roseococcus sp. SDR]|uniref:hypothetical protein n=1 Tax=Roseococcus sp. SDR TaxID=2835532 RepID=UPI001BCEC0A4|nr:hypothetical protein [Roseococcus sp. SDR]MBS7789796.1 hypothetical protein [Roseococcus sp. SDR]MBV1845110.1 hypothetical protein [Roseococcus sp. SDR]